MQKRILRVCWLRFTHLIFTPKSWSLSQALHNAMHAYSCNYIGGDLVIPINPRIILCAGYYLWLPNTVFIVVV